MARRLTGRHLVDAQPPGGPRILVTWGANAGDAASTSRVVPSETTSPSASTMTLSATWAANSTSWVATITACPSSARRRRISASSALAG